MATKEEYERNVLEHKALEANAMVAAETYAVEKREALKKLEPMVLEIYGDYADHENNWFFSQLYNLDHVGACDKVSIGENNIRISGRRPACSRGCCGYETVYVDAPAACLYTDISTVVDTEMSAIRLRLETELAAKREVDRVEAEEQQKLQEESDREEYERLKGKYEAT